MKRMIVVALLMLVGLVACGGGGDSGPTAPPAEKFAFEGERFSAGSSVHTVIDGTIRNVSGEAQYVYTVGYRAFNADVIVESGEAFVNATIPPGGGAAYHVIVRTGGQTVTRWERWVRQL